MEENKLKKFLFKISLLSLIFIVSSSAIEEEGNCDVNTLKNNLIQLLKPDFKYDSSKTSRFTYKNKKQLKEIEIPLYMGEKYRFLFNTAGLSKNIKIEVFSKKIGHKKRKLLYELKPEEGKHIYNFEPSKSRKMYLNYTIPKVDVVEGEEPLRGCMIFLLGYRIKI